MVLEGKQTCSVLVLSGNSPFVTSQRDRCIFSYLETDQEAAVCWGSVSMQSQPDDEKNEKQHHDINGTVLMPPFIPSAERETLRKQRTEYSTGGGKVTSAYCGTFEKQHVLRSSAADWIISCSHTSFFFFFVQFFNQCWSCGRCREGQQANFKEPCAASPRVFDSFVQYRALFNIFSFQHKTHVQSKRKKGLSFFFFFLLFFTLSHRRPFSFSSIDVGYTAV